jgi:transcriptional accessory protein Tex/SPT6
LEFWSLAGLVPLFSIVLIQVGISDPNSDSYKVYKYLTEDLKQSDPAVVIIVDSGATDVTDPAIAQKGIALEKKIAQGRRRYKDNFLLD